MHWWHGQSNYLLDSQLHSRSKWWLGSYSGVLVEYPADCLSLIEFEYQSGWSCVRVYVIWVLMAVCCPPNRCTMLMFTILGLILCIILLN